VNDYRIFEIDVSARFEVTRRDVDGWVTGQAPGNGNYAPAETTTHRIVAKRECMARARALDLYSGSGIKDVEIVKVASHKVDGLVVELA
jgi:hypothetical protein